MIEKNMAYIMKYVWLEYIYFPMSRESGINSDRKLKLAFCTLLVETLRILYFTSCRHVTDVLLKI